ncbi:MAG: hypothetical protein FWH20_08335 [Oscillospiraceae bacterium]|nr:hypothetical protein [Oscillospiraceae bacterium]
MKRLLFPLLLILYLIEAIVAFWLYSEISSSDRTYDYALIYVALGITVVAGVLCVINIIFAVRKVKKFAENFAENKKKLRAVNRAVLAFKLLAMPFFVVNYAFWFVANIALGVNTLIFISMIIIPLAVGFAFLVLLASSAYSIALLRALHTNGAITKRELKTHTVFQLLFVFDVVDSLVVQKYTKKNTKIKRK